MKTTYRFAVWTTCFGIALRAFCLGAAHAENVALTFDDLPTLSLTTSLAYAQTTTKRLLIGLHRNVLPATGFVNERKLEGATRAARTELLKRWLIAGMDLGDHGYSHLSLNRTPVELYIADTARGEAVTSSLLRARGKPLRWFRYPYLETGLTVATRATFENWLTSHRYRVAPVTMENSDWIFAIPYDDAILRNDPKAAKRIRKSYLQYTATMVSWYRKAAFGLLKRRPSFVFLLHASRLNADSIDKVAKILKAQDLKPVSLDVAMEDPAYSIADTYVGPEGQEWLSRWSLTLHKDLPWADFQEPPTDIAAEDKRLEPNE